MTTVALTEDEVDKRVVDSDGTELGVVVDVHHGVAHVSADSDTVEEMKTRLPEGSIDEGTYALDDGSVTEITDDRIVLAVDP